MPYTRLAAGALAILLAACGGGDPNESVLASSASGVAATPDASGDSSPAGDAMTDLAAAARKPVGTCTALEAMPKVPANALSVADYGVTPSDARDNGAAIQAALDALKPGDWLIFPAGTYLHSKSLRVRAPGVVLWSNGATLLATNPDDTAIVLQADGVSMYGFRLHAVTGTRGSKLTQARIAVAPAGSGRVRNVTVRRNIVENGAAAGTPQANGSSASGIFVYRAEGFLVAENTVRRTLADGIHVTAGSNGGRIIGNIVRESGDDMIAVVSYMGSTGTPIGTLLADMPTLRAERLSRNLLIANNDVAGQYWGRGITVVGGEDITIEGNRISDATYAAGILLARESSYLTFGVRNVLVQNNTVRHVQTTAPPYSIGSKASAPRTGHAGIEIHALATTEEMRDPLFSAAIAVQTVRVEGNVVDDTLADGIRLGVGTGPVGLIGVVDNRLTRIGKTAINIRNNPTPDFNVFCSGNTLDGNPTTNNLCMGRAPAASGAALACSL